MTQPQPQPNTLAEQAVPIVYVGAKPEKHDTVNHTGIVWKRGETLMYPAKYAKGLLVHTDVWKIGKKADVGKVNEDYLRVLAAATPVNAGDLEFSSWGGPQKGEEPELSQRDMVHDREGSTKQSRVSLE
jgi:hypothetical protein